MFLNLQYIAWFDLSRSSKLGCKRPFFFKEWWIFQLQNVSAILAPSNRPVPGKSCFFSSCGMFTGAVWLVNLKFAAKSAEVLPRWLCITSKEMFCKLRYPFLSYYAKVTTFIYNWSPNGRKKKGISHIFCWIHENFVDICLEIKLWILKTITADWFSVRHNFWLEL